MRALTGLGSGLLALSILFEEWGLEPLQWLLAHTASSRRPKQRPLPCKTTGAFWGGATAPQISRADQSRRSAGSVPPLAAMLRITCLCRPMFQAAEPGSSLPL